jgi:bifunctional DNA-binding transcriptional regulator/antitoxin component of YhaV-PrlF toxin-antitoxin module
MPKKSAAKSARPTKTDCCGEGCCGDEATCCGMPAASCCKVEAVVSVDARGQMVLQKEVRDQFGIEPGAKLAIVAWSNGDAPCCLSLHKADEIADRLRASYGPILREIVR